MTDSVVPATEPQEEKAPDINEVITEATWPDLSRETFVLKGVEIKIKPLQVKYAIELGKILHPFLKSLGIDIKYIDNWKDPQEWLPLVMDVFPHTNIVAETVWLIVQNDSKRLSGLNIAIPTKDDILESGSEEGDLQYEDMIEICIALFNKNKRIAGPVMDFFKNALNAATKELANLSATNDTKKSTPEEAQAQPEEVEAPQQNIMS